MGLSDYLVLQRMQAENAANSLWRFLCVDFYEEPEPSVISLCPFDNPRIAQSSSTYIR
jgi:hypothetical protein